MKRFEEKKGIISECEGFILEGRRTKLYLILDERGHKFFVRFSNEIISSTNPRLNWLTFRVPVECVVYSRNGQRV